MKSTSQCKSTLRVRNFKSSSHISCALQKFGFLVDFRYQVVLFLDTRPEAAAERAGFPEVHGEGRRMDGWGSTLPASR